MKKQTIFIVISILVLFSASNIGAQNRGALTNVYASWFQASTTQQTLTFPYPSRDLWIRNGGGTDEVCVSPTGADITTGTNKGLGGCRSTDNSFVFQLNGNEEARFEDFETTSISVRTMTSTSSPIQVVVTY